MIYYQIGMVICFVGVLISSLMVIEKKSELMIGFFMAFGIAVLWPFVVISIIVFLVVYVLMLGLWNLVNPGRSLK